MVCHWAYEPHSRAGHMPRNNWSTKDKGPIFVAFFLFSIFCFIVCFYFHFLLERKSERKRYTEIQERTWTWMGRKVRKRLEELVHGKCDQTILYHFFNIKTSKKDIGKTNKAIKRTNQPIKQTNPKLTSYLLGRTFCRTHDACLISVL